MTVRHIPGIQPPWAPPWAPGYAPGAGVGGDGIAEYPYSAIWMMNRPTLAECLDGRWVAADPQSTSWRWTADSGGSTASTGTGPSPNALHAYCYIETSGETTLALDERRTRGQLSMQTNGEGAAWLTAARDRVLTLRVCLQGDFGGVTDDGRGEGLTIYGGRVAPGPLTIIDYSPLAHIRGWGYAEDYVAGDSITDYGGVTFTVAEDGGWRDIVVPIPADIISILAALLYAAESGGEASYRQDIAIRWVRLEGVVSDPALATAPPPAPVIREMAGFRADDLAGWDHSPWSSDDTGGGWIGRHSAGSTPTSQTGPAPSNTLPYVHTDVEDADLDAQATRGILTLLTGPGDPGRAWAEAARDRVVRLRLCMQGHWGHSGEGLYVEGRASAADSWSSMSRRVYGWLYSAPAEAPAVDTDYAGLYFRRVATGGWRDVSVDILPGVRQLRIRPQYAGTPRERHDVAIARIELGYHA